MQAGLMCGLLRRVEGVMWAEAGCAGLDYGWTCYIYKNKANQMEAKTRLFSTAKLHQAGLTAYPRGPSIS